MAGGVVNAPDAPLPTTSTFRAADGVELVVDTWPGTGDPALPPVLLHHGFAADVTTNWVTPGIVRALSDAGRTVIAIDARGHGRSGKPHDPEAYGHSAMSRDVSTLLDELGAARSITAVDLVGYSMGGYVAAITAAREPQRVRRVVIGGIGAPALTPRALSRNAIADALEADDPRTVTDRGARQFRRFADSTGSDRLALAACMRAPFEPLVGLDRITMPSLVLVGADDDLATDPQRLAAAIPGARLVITEGDHLRAPSVPAYRAAIVEFLAGPDVPDAPAS